MAHGHGPPHSSRQVQHGWLIMWSNGLATDMETHPKISTSVAPFLGGPMDHVTIIEHPKPKSKLKHMNSLALTPSISC